jgi:hypothetical protein
MAVTRILRTYRFIDKDPGIDETRTLVQDAGLYSKAKLKLLAELAGLSVSTLLNMYFGGTKTPHNATLMAIGTALGHERVWRKARSLNLEEELEFARAWNKREMARRKREREKEEPKKKQRRKKKVA